MTVSNTRHNAYFYRIAGLLCKVLLPLGCEPHRFLPTCEPFVVEPTDEEVVCTVVWHATARPSIPADAVLLGREEADLRGVPMSLYETSTHYLIEQCDDARRFVCDTICSKDFSYNEVYLSADAPYASRALTSHFMIAFSQVSVLYHTILIHSSVVSLRGYGYAFLGKSGTGKSTHSSLWLKHIFGTSLLNDDNPAIQLRSDGSVRVYGTPWSGKTPCYKNEDAVLGALVQLKQAPYNRIEKQVGMRAFATLLPSCSSMRWNNKLYNALCDILAGVVETVGIYQLECLPDAEAAQVCSNTIQVKLNC